MNDLPTAGRVGAAVQRLADTIGAHASYVPIHIIGRSADRAAGLEAAAHALAAAGCTAPAVLGHEADGRPQWPAEFTGSIAHAGGVAVAVASRSTVVGVLGVDVELAGALPARDADAVLDARERALVATAAHPDHLATLLWSAKEAAFKAWSSATAGGLGDVDPIDIHVELDASFGRGDEPIGVRLEATGPLAARVAAVGPLCGWCVRVSSYVPVLVTDGTRRAGQPVDGMASEAITSPSAANATT